MRIVPLLIAFFTVCFLGGKADADAIYTLNYDSCTGGCGNGQGTNNNSFGYVTLGQTASNQVTVTLQITDPSYIVNTGSGSNHAPFAFNTDKGVTITNIADGISSPSTYFTVGATNATVSGLGTFGYEIACTSSCANGASHGGEGTYLSFVVTANSGALNLNNFVANSGGYFFASDIVGPSGRTGEVAANRAPTTTGGGSAIGVPEPDSLMIVASGLAAFGALRRRIILRRCTGPDDKAPVGRR